MEHALEIRGLCKSYGSFGIKDVSFALPKGKIMGFVGPNGAGKTTTIKSILGMIKPDFGEVKIFGKCATSQDNAEIGVVMDTPFYEEMWKISDVKKAVKLFHKHFDGKKFDKYIEKFGIDITKRVKDLSRGMGVKLMIAVALSHDAKLLILDEPTSGLDPVSRDELCDILLEYVSDRGGSVLFSTHITSDLEKIADYITCIIDGSIAFLGEKDSILKDFAENEGLSNLEEIVVFAAKGKRVQNV